MRTISGVVDAEGNIKHGTGNFDVRRQSTGLYDITFRPVLNKIYGGAATQIFYYDNGQGGDTRDNAVIVLLEHDEMLIKTGGSSGDPRDREFTFIVTGE